MNESNKKRLEDRIFGCFLGSAIGNAMGSNVEGWTYEKIEKNYGKIVMPLMLDRIQTEDDYRIAMLFTQAYLKYKTNIIPEDLASIWKENFDPGNNFFWCMRNTLELLNQGLSPRITGIHNINTGSAIMAIAPVGLFNYGDPDRAYSDALELAYMYQPKPDAQCAAAMAAGFSVALMPNVTCDLIVDTIIEHCLDEDIEYWDKNRKIKNIKESVYRAKKIAEKYGNDWWGAREEIYASLNQWHMIDPMEVLSITLCLFKMTEGNYKEGVIAGTNIGRDSDTISNLIGGLACAMNGTSQIPDEWIEGVKEINIDLYDKLNIMAREFASLLAKRIQRYSDISKDFFSYYGA